MAMKTLTVVFNEGGSEATARRAVAWGGYMGQVARIATGFPYHATADPTDDGGVSVRIEPDYAEYRKMSGEEFNALQCDVVAIWAGIHWLLGLPLAGITLIRPRCAGND